MAQARCALCDNEVPSAEFDLLKSFSLYSKTPLMLLLQSCINERLLMTNYLVCKMCYILLNELDNIKLRAKNIGEQLKNYVYKYVHTPYGIKTPRIEVNSINLEECRICLKKISSESFKNHVKAQHPELNELETNFDLDEVNSLSDINPSFEDISILANEETEKSDIVKLRKKGSAENKTRKKDTTVKPYKCTACFKTWKTQTELKSHMLAHSDEKPYICEICGQSYKRQQALAIHVGMHNGINPFTCVYCNKSFTQKGALVRHTPIHTGELPYQCDLCGKRFVHHTSFNMHRLSHSGQKSYKCEVCGLLLMSGSHLKRHMRVHTGEKKFTCVTCGKKFAEKYNLAVHEKLHLGIPKKKKSVEYGKTIP